MMKKEEQRRAGYALWDAVEHLYPSWLIPNMRMFAVCAPKGEPRLVRGAYTATAADDRDD